MIALITYAPVKAQTPPPAGTLVGRIIDAATNQAVPAATVTLEPTTSGLTVDPRNAVVLASVRTIVTGESGAYRFTDVTPGRYRLRIERLGYRAVTVEVEVRRPVEAALSVGLELAPVSLEPVQVEQRAAALFQRAANGPSELDEARLASERWRQSQFLAPDTRMLTYADVMDGVTLGEGDVFRALQRFPGVGTRDDYTAELWTRGAPWTQTRVTFDGVPLFNPVHAVGVLSAISPEVLGSVFLHPGMRPASVADGAAGVVDLRSRPGGGDGNVRGVADLSMASAKLVLDQNIAQRGAWVISARRSHLNVLSNNLGSLGLDTIALPYVFHDLAGRADFELGRRSHLEASGLWEEDRIEGDVEGVLERTTAHWGNTAGRITLRNLIGSVEVAHSLGASRFRVRTDERLVRTRDPATWTEPASRNEIAFTQLGGQLTPVAPGQPARWSLGYDIAWQRGDYDGPLPRYYAVRPDTIYRLRSTNELRIVSLFGDARVALGNSVTLNPGLRVETGGDIADAPDVRVAPRVALRWTVSEQQNISIAAGRGWQYLQAIAQAGPSIHPAFHASHYWIWPNQLTPAIRADIASIGSERWFGRGWLVSANAFIRRANGVAAPVPDTGLLTPRRPNNVYGENRARGLELNLRRLGAQWSTSLGYSYGVSEMNAGGHEFPSSADRRHVLDAMIGVRVLRSLRLAAAYTAMSGAPYTRAYSRSLRDCELFGFGCGNPAGSLIQSPNAERTPAYSSLDASLHWNHQLGRVDLSAYLQVRNVLNRDNASTYSGSNVIGAVSRQPVVYVWDDRFERGLPRLPLVGLRLTF